jgi:hypothetical protein
VRRILEGSGKVKAVFMGHTHTSEIRTAGGVRYATLQLDGFRRHAEHPLHGVRV